LRYGGDPIHRDVYRTCTLQIITVQKKEKKEKGKERKREKKEKGKERKGKKNICTPEVHDDTEKR
jgi:hypothetical protein